jgi:hypothetical protein
VKNELIAILVILNFGTALAAEVIENQIYETSGHIFLSSADTTNVTTYEVCNQSAVPSTFFWSGARFGADAKGPLPPQYCVRKAHQPIPYSDLLVEPTTVIARNWSDESVPTIIYCPVANRSDEGVCPYSLFQLLGRSIIQLSVFADDPDGQPYSIDQSRFEILQNAEELLVSVEPGTELSILVFPESTIDVDEGAELIRVLEGSGFATDYGSALVEFGYAESRDFFGSGSFAFVISSETSLSITSDERLGITMIPSMLTSGIIVTAPTTISVLDQ